MRTLIKMLPVLCLMCFGITALAAAQASSPAQIRSGRARSRADSTASSQAAVLLADAPPAGDQHPDSLAVPQHGPPAPLPEPSVQEQGFDVSRPVATEPFDYSKLDPHDYTLSAVRIKESIRLDGRMTEDVWKLATPATHFYQLEPAEGYPATQPTEVRVLYDEKNLYVGFMCYDSEPDHIMAPDMQRDTRMTFSNDMVRVVIAPLEGGRESYEFQVNPNGARTDVFVSKEGASQDRDWNANWNAAAARDARGWSAEFMIPFHELRFSPKAEQTWSINFGRRIQRNREDTFWVPLSLRDGDRGLYKFQRGGGRLVGLRNLKPGGKIQATPFTVLGSQGTRNALGRPTATNPVAPTAMDYGFQRDVGGDLKWSLTSGLTLNATANPDFAQVEADDQVVNLSRFEFRFDEKRPFFLERNDIFSLGGRSGRGGPRGPSSIPELFFSRRVGRQLPNGSSVPIDLGLRLTGKIGRTTVGYLNVQTRETRYLSGETIKTEPVTDWQALRVSRDFGSRSNVGLLATFKEPDPGMDNGPGLVLPRFSSSDYNRVLGFDMTLASRRTQHEVQIIVARSWTDSLSDKSEQGLWRIQHRWQNRWLQFGTSYMEIGNNFIAQSGFVRQTDIRRIGNRTTFNPFIRKYGLRRITARISTEYLTDRNDGFFNPETWRINPSITFELEAGVWLVPGWSRTFDTVGGTSNRRIAGVHFSPGPYRYDQKSFFFFTDSGRRLSGNGSIRSGQFFGGDITSVFTQVNYKPTSRFSFSPGLTWNKLTRDDRIGLDADEFDYSNRIIPRFRFNYSFSPNLSVTSFVQFDTDKRRPEDSFHLNTVTSNFLISYRSPLGHTFFFAVNQFSDDAIDTADNFDPFRRTPLRLRDQTLVAKISYLLNL